VLVAVTLSYEIIGALDAMGPPVGCRLWDSPYMGLVTALAVGKLFGLNEDQLANALSLALVPHMPMWVSHVGALSHWKNCHDPEAVRCGVWAALLARAGMTGPCQPFEGRGGLWDNIGAPKKLHLPATADGELVVQKMSFKSHPADTGAQALLGLIDEFRAWTKIEDIGSIQIELSHCHWMETSDPPKWDPRNHETADHSMPYLIVRALIDGEVYLHSFTADKIMDPVARALMDKTTVLFNPEFSDYSRSRITVRTKAGGELTKEAAYFRGHPRNRMSREEHTAKFSRVCDYMRVEPRQRDRALVQWSNLQAVQDIVEPIQNLAKFGRPMPL
jgi:2-methylcitrate dehydratase